MERAAQIKSNPSAEYLKYFLEAPDSPRSPKVRSRTYKYLEPSLRKCPMPQLGHKRLSSGCWKERSGVFMSAEWQTIQDSKGYLPVH